MPRPYTMSPKAREARRKGATVTNSVDNLIKRIVDRAPELTPDQIERLRPLLAKVPTTGGGEIE